MYNWSTNTAELKKDKNTFNKWKLEQMVNFGLNGQKISKKLLIKYWSELDLDESRKRFLSYLLWGKLS